MTADKPGSVESALAEGDAVTVPEWAEKWARGTCGCGGRLCRVDCYCGGHIVCSVSGWDTERCDR